MSTTKPSNAHDTNFDLMWGKGVIDYGRLKETTRHRLRRNRMREHSNDFERVRAFVDGAKTGIDWLNHKGSAKTSETPEYEDGFRSALDAIGGFIADIDEEKDTSGVVL